MKIQNFDELAITPLRRAALEIAEAGLEAIDTRNVIKNVVNLRGDSLKINGHSLQLEKISRVFVVGVGKCALAAGTTLEKILGDKLSGGIILDIKSAESSAQPKLQIFQGTHPLPSERNVEATKAIVNFLSNLQDNDLVIFLISGGGSTLLCLPENDDWEKESLIIKSLMNSGADIQEMNAVRKHLSYARGGFLAKYAYPAKAISLIFSDVPGDSIEFVASGPTVKDNTTLRDAEKILTKYNVLQVCGIEHCELIETPKEDIYFERIENLTAVSSHTALAAMEKKSRALGFDVKVHESRLTGEATAAGRDIAKEINSAGHKTVLLYGGETTVKTGGIGRGGRNLEVGLSALRYINNGEIIVTVASDGHDNGHYAGAVCDMLTREAVAINGLDMESALRDHDTYPFFEKIGNYLMTGDTGSNVADLMIAIKS